jgi:hypothetical protein
VIRVAAKPHRTLRVLASAGSNGSSASGRGASPSSSQGEERLLAEQRRLLNVQHAAAGQRAAAAAGLEALSAATETADGQRRSGVLRRWLMSGAAAFALFAAAAYPQPAQAYRGGLGGLFGGNGNGAGPGIAGGGSATTTLPATMENKASRSWAPN